MAELRPHLKREEFLRQVRDMEADGYQLAYLKGDGAVVAVAGYRVSSNLFMGKHLYVDDLVTSSTVRSKGYGEVMMAWLRDQAVNAACHYLHLDSGTHRDQAHKFYFRQGLTIASYHFSEKLNVL
ncbi:MAG: GNAT family N-acetyltransferase [Pseudomonadales bacterium]|nr:GNAT family N-acetyltransferase [Pseudomonadales bacterium]